MPALPLHDAGAYVAGAYVVLLAVVLLYVAIMAARLARIERELGALDELLGGGPGNAAGPGRSDQPATGAGTATGATTVRPAVRAEAGAGTGAAP